MRTRIIRKLRTSWLGSGPRGRWFKSTRPDPIFKNPQEIGRVKSSRSLGIAAQIGILEPSARLFKLRVSPNPSRSRQTRSHPSFLAGKHGLKPLGLVVRLRHLRAPLDSNLYALPRIGL